MIPRLLLVLLALAFAMLLLGWLALELINAALPKPIIIVGTLFLILLGIVTLSWCLKRLNNDNPKTPKNP